MLDRRSGSKEGEGAGIDDPKGDGPGVGGTADRLEAAGAFGKSASRRRTLSVACCTCARGGTMLKRRDCASGARELGCEYLWRLAPYG